MRSDVENLGPRKQRRLVEVWRDVRPRVVSAEWTLIERYNQGAHWRRLNATGDPVSTLFLVVEFIDGELWLHLSYSHVDRTPGWDEMREAKRAFMGANTKAISIVPPDSEHYNHHPYCLHLFACLERDPLPDMRDSRGRL